MSAGIARKHGLAGYEFHLGIPSDAMKSILAGSALASAGKGG